MSSEQEARTKRIVDSAIALAEEGGFEAVRLRDIASHANVALGTVYKRFASKEDILLAALNQELGLLEQVAVLTPPSGKGYVERLNLLFGLCSRGFFLKPNLARATLRASTSGNSAISDKVEAFHKRITSLLTKTLIEWDVDNELDAFDSDRLETFVFLSSQLWFSALVGWMTGFFDEQQVMDQVHTGVIWFSKGFESDA